MNNDSPSPDSSKKSTPAFSAAVLRKSKQWDHIQQDSRPDAEHFHDKAHKFGCVDLGEHRQSYGGRGFATMGPLSETYDDFIQWLKELNTFADLNHKGLPESYNAGECWVRKDGTRHLGWGVEK